MMQKPVPAVLEGAEVPLEPLSMDHLDGLCAVGLDPELWQWIPTPVRNPDEMQAYVQDALDEQRRGISMPFATLLKSNRQVVGCTRYANMSLKDSRVEIGWTWIGKPWQRSAVNTEAKYLMLRHAFEVMGCERVELKTDALNERSRNAIQRIGAKQEGIFRNHVICADGRIRNSVYFSIIDSEWPQAKTALEEKLRRA